MKRVLALIITLLLLCGSACASPALSPSLCSAAMKTLSCLDTGAYEHILMVLPFADLSPSAAEWQSFADGNFSTLGNGVQNSKCLSYFSNGCWKIAVSVDASPDSSTECLVILSDDGTNASGYDFSTWGRIKKAADAAEEVQ